MSAHRSSGTSRPRHRRRSTALAFGIPLVLTAAGTLAYGADLGLLGADAQAKADRKSVV